MKKVLSLLLSVLMLITAIPLAGFVASADYSYITLGSYPQSKVTDARTLKKLKFASKTWISYGYFEDANTPGDYMQYCDIQLDGAKYRGVKFSKYRPRYTTNTASTNLDYVVIPQHGNGYYIDTEYYFLYEPLTWRVLDADTGLVMCESIIDSQAYNDYYYDGYVDAAQTTYVNKWETSSIRQWLNDDFYNTAFSADAKTLIVQSTITNLGYSGYYDYADTEDNIFLLNDEEEWGYVGPLENSLAQGTDYAKSQGLWAYSDGGACDGSSYWRLRSAGYYSYSTCDVFWDGSCRNRNTYRTDYGIRPAFYCNLESEIPQETVCTCKCHKSGIVGIFWKIKVFFWKIFGKTEYRYCECGEAHW